MGPIYAAVSLLTYCHVNYNSPQFSFGNIKLHMGISRTSLGQVGDFEIRLLRIFHSIVEHGGFSAAESSLGLNRSTISQHISDLEKRLGVRLCKRGRAGFALTEEGRTIYRASQNLFSALEGFRSEANAIHHNLRGEFCIGIINNLVTQPRMRITHALRTLCEKGPESRIKISMTTPQEVEMGVLNGQLHVGAVPLVTPLSGLNYLPLYEENSFLYCSSDHPFFPRSDAGISIDEVRRSNAVIANYRLPERGQECQRALRCRAIASDREGIAFLILTGNFIGYLPDYCAKRWVDIGSMRMLQPDVYHFQTSLCVATRKGRRPNLVLECFLDALDRSE
jgi:DNA-binding transcriptional LysR family regulator